MLTTCFHVYFNRAKKQNKKKVWQTSAALFIYGLDVCWNRCLAIIKNAAHPCLFVFAFAECLKSSVVCYFAFFASQLCLIGPRKRHL